MLSSAKKLKAFYAAIRHQIIFSRNLVTISYELLIVEIDNQNSAERHEISPNFMEKLKKHTLSDFFLMCSLSMKSEVISDLR